MVLVFDDVLPGYYDNNRTFFKNISYTMLRISLLLSVLLVSFKSFGQGLPPCPPITTVTASNDTTICNSVCADFSAVGVTTLKGSTTYAEYGVAYSAQPYSGSSIKNFGGVDDGFGPVETLPFPFCYFGQTYTQFVIGTNGVISFDIGNANAYCPWPIGGPIPGSNCAATINAIMAPWNDLYPPGGGTISTAVYGTAPCRQFVISWQNVQLFNGGTCPGMFGTQQIILYETTNAIDINMENRPQCNGWNSGRAVMGIEAAGGNPWYSPVTRNGVPWGTANESWRYLPNDAPIENYIWRDSATGGVVGNGQTVQLCPTQATTYVVEYQAIVCGQVSSAFDTVRVKMGVADTIENFVGTDPTMCGAKNGYIVLTNMVPGDTFIVHYDINGIPQPTVNIIVASDGSITIPNLDTGTYDNIYIETLEGCESNHVGPLTLVNPPFAVAFDTVVTRACEVDSVQLVDQSIGVTQYAWDFGDGSTSTVPNPLHVYQDQGIYNITLVGTNGFCTDTKSLTVDLLHPIDAGYSFSEDSICNGETIFFTDNSQTTYTATYFWNFGDGASANTPNTSHQYTTDGIYNASLTLTDFLGCVSIESHEIVVGSIAVEIGPQDTTVCLADSMMLYSHTTNSPYFSDGIEYAWSPTDNLGSPNAAQTTYYNETPGDYTYVLTATGYPMECVAKDTLTIHVQPRPVLVNVTPDQVIKFGTNVQLHAEGVLYYIWMPPATLDNPTISSPIASPTEPTLYTVIGMNEHGGCRDTAEVMVDIDYSMTEFIPSVFSPNGDGKNDVFRIVNMKFQKLVEFRVFNRWGKELYSTTDVNKGWDGTWNGTPQDPGVYTYLIRVNLPDGNTRAYKGNVTLIR
jgi:gliding motility-associated-like protein